MLTKMPKVGDVLIAKDCPGIRKMGDMTAGREYKVVSRYGSTEIIDDDGDGRVMCEMYLNRFTLKNVVTDCLTSVPKVGDVVIAKESQFGMGGIADITKGMSYTITEVSDGGRNAWFRDDSGMGRIIDTNRLEHFTLKVEAPTRPVGFIEINREYDFLVGKTRLVLDVDADGLATIKALTQDSKGERYKSELADKIAQCQAEMDHLNAMLAEVE